MGAFLWARYPCTSRFLSPEHAALTGTHPAKQWTTVGLSVQPICTRCCFIMIDMIQVCSNFIEPEYLS